MELNMYKNFFLFVIKIFLYKKYKKMLLYQEKNKNYLIRGEARINQLVKASMRMWLLLKKQEKVVDQSNGLKANTK